MKKTKLKEPTAKEPGPPVAVFVRPRRRRTPTPEENQLAQLEAYLNQHFCDGSEYATPVGRATELLNKLRAKLAEEKEAAEISRAHVDQARANMVKSAVARLVGGYQKVSTDELKKLAIEMCTDEEFWRELSTLNWQQDRMRKLLGPLY